MVLYAFMAMSWSAASLVALHYAAAWHTGGRMWPRVVSYTLGVLAILVPVSLWLIVANGCVAPMTVVAMLWATVAVDGLTVGGLYLLDAWLAERRERMDTMEREAALLSEVLHDTHD